MESLARLSIRWQLLSLHKRHVCVPNLFMSTRPLTCAHHRGSLHPTQSAQTHRDSRNCSLALLERQVGLCAGECCPSGLTATTVPIRVALISTSKTDLLMFSCGRGKGGRVLRPSPGVPACSSLLCPCQSYIKFCPRFEWSLKVLVHTRSGVFITLCSDGKLSSSLGWTILVIQLL